MAPRARKAQILTSDVVAEDARRDDLSVGAEERLQILLRHALGQAGHVEVGTLYRVRAGPGKGHLDGLVLQPQPVEGVDRLVRVLRAVVVDEAVAETLASHLVADQLATLHVSDAGEERLHLLLGHGLWQVVDYQVRLRIILSTADGARPPVLLRRVQSVGNHLDLCLGVGGYLWGSALLV